MPPTRLLAACLAVEFLQLLAVALLVRRLRRRLTALTRTAELNDLTGLAGRRGLHVGSSASRTCPGNNPNGRHGSTATSTASSSNNAPPNAAAATTSPPAGSRVDACWGYFGLDYARSRAVELFGDAVRPAPSPGGGVR